MARSFIQGFAEQGGHNVITDGRQSVTDVQRSFPGAQVRVLIGGTSTLATIYADIGGTPLANPFTASNTGYWGFWADDGTYDIRFSGAGILTPFTLFNFVIGGSGAINDPGSNGYLVRTAPNTATPRTILGTTNETLVTNGDGVLGNTVIGLASFLDLTTKTLSGGTYLSPGIANFGNALHNHEGAAGGGQFNATNIFSSGTVPVARLPLMVGASGIANGVAGLVPAPLIADAGNFLRGDGTWATAGGGGGGTPGGGSGQVQYNNAGSFGGITGATSDGTNMTFGSTNLRATRPRFITSIDDTNGNEIIGITSVGSAINELTVANAAIGGSPSISATGGDTNINIVLTPKGSGQISSAGNLQLSNVAPQITLIDTNDSKQLRLLLSGNNFQIVNDTLGVSPVNISTVDSVISFIGDMNITNTSPEINLIDSGGSVCHLLNDGGFFFLYQTPGQDLIQGNLTTQVVRFPQIPTGPGVNPTTADQLTRKQYVDETSLPFSINWFEFDPSSSTVSAEDRPGFLVPATVNTAIITHCLMSFSAGSDLPGGASLSITFRRRNSGGGAADWATATLTSAHNGQAVHSFDIADQQIFSNDRITYFISSRVGTINPRCLSIALVGTWRRV